MSAHTSTAVDFDRFRLRTLLNRLIELGEVDIHEEPVALSDLSRIIESTPNAVLFRRAGPEAHELLANVTGTRRRLAAALEVKESEAHDVIIRRLKSPGSIIEVTSEEAPVQQVVLQGDQVDLTKLPFHFQHELDGGPYLSSAVDFAVNPATGLINVGARRLSLRNRTECGTNLTNPSHLKEIYLKAVAQKKRLPVAFTIGAHPTVALGAQVANRADELATIGALRGVPLPVVKCVTCDVRVPADAEAVLEGYLDEKGYREPEGPYGEYLGYYGELHPDPVFHCTAITMRRDPLHLTVLHGSRDILKWSDNTQNTAFLTEALILDILRSNAVAEVTGVHIKRAAGTTQHARIAIRQRRPGQARQAIAAVLGTVWRIKHLWVYDEDIDVANDEQCEWAMSTRFQGDRDLVMLESACPWPIDPSLDGRRVGTKLGFDCTAPFGRAKTIITTPAKVAVIPRQPARFKTVREALQDGPKYFQELMVLLASSDGRELMLAIDQIREEGMLSRNHEGQFLLRLSKPGETAIVD